MAERSTLNVASSHGWHTGAGCYVVASVRLHMGLFLWLLELPLSIGLGSKSKYFKKLELATQSIMAFRARCWHSVPFPITF